MAFADPTVLATGTAAASMARVSLGDNRSTYRSADGLYTFTVSHDYGKRSRSVIKVTKSKIAADPFVPSVNQKFTENVYLVIDRPPTGFSSAEVTDLVQALLVNLSASAYANVTKMTAGES